MATTPRNRRRSASFACAVWALTLCAPTSAAAQHGMALGHGFARPQEARALHVRLERADAVAFGTVREVGLGRIQVGDATAVVGEVPVDLELKRSPSSPPPLEAGDRALLILRGARSPYLLVDEAHETTVLADADAEARWARAVAAVAAALDTPRQLAELYLTWLEAPDPDLQRAAVAGLRDRRAPFQPLPRDLLARTSELALEPALPPDVRAGVATIASADPEGRAALLARLPGGPEACDPGVLLVALQSAALARDPGLAAAVLRALRHPDPRIRETGLRFAGLARTDAAIRGAVERMAQGDPDRALRRAAERYAEGIAESTGGTQVEKD